MISRERAVLLVSLLENQSEKLVDINSKFQSSFNMNERIVALYGLSILLGDQLLDKTEQIVAVWLLFCEFEGIPVSEHPFCSVFNFLFDLRKVDAHACLPQLYDIISHLFAGGTVESIGSFSVDEILSPSFSIPGHAVWSSPGGNPAKIRVSPILVETNEHPSTDVIPHKDVLIEFLSNDILFTDFEPQIMRPAPNLMPITSTELAWSYVNSPENPPGLFDDVVSIHSRDRAIAMILRAADGKLKPEEVAPLSDELEKSPDLAVDAHLSVEQIESMVETCPVIATHAFKALVQKEPRLIEYLAKTLISETSAEVAKGVLTIDGLPDEYIERYVNGQIKLLQDVRNQQVFVKKMALFCKMLSDIFCEGLRFKNRLLMDLYSFCVEHESVKEAQELEALLSS